MASSFSFDIVCEVDAQEVTNAVDQAQREIGNRYDFKGTQCAIDFERNEMLLKLTADDEMKLSTVRDILLSKLLKRNVPVKSLVYGKAEPSGKVLKQDITIQQGLNKEQCKTLNLLVKNAKLKVQSQIQGESVRVTGKSKDDLQAIMQTIKSQDLDFDVQFTNYR
jgi:uncharacterized protein YajQ (UPF0234 family)